MPLPQPSFDLTDRLALVTGSSRGLGWAMAQALAGAGARIILHGRDAHALALRAAELTQAGAPPAAVMRFDVADSAATAAAFADIAARFGRLDILLANAGSFRRKPLLETTDADWSFVIDSHLAAGFRLAREAARLMLPQGKGRIIMVSSISATITRPTLSSYAAAKAGLNGFVRAIAVELAPAGITVNAIAPGNFPSDGNATLRQDPDFYRRMAQRAPMARWGDPSELGGAAIFLASDASAFITGQVIAVDGGLTAAV